MNNTKQLTVEFAGENRKSFLGLLASSKPVFIDMTEIESIDLSGIQILIALIHEAMSTKKEFHLTGNICSEIQGRLILAGICEEPCLSGEQLEEILKTVS